MCEKKRNELRLILYTIHLLSRSLRYFFLRILAQRNVICPTDRAIKSVKQRYYKKKLLVATRSILAKKMGPKQVKLFMGFGGKQRNSFDYDFLLFSKVAKSEKQNYFKIRSFRYCVLDVDVYRKVTFQCSSESTAIAKQS